MITLEQAEQALGMQFFAHQLKCFEGAKKLGSPLRCCLYFKTGSGKSITALVLLAQEGYQEALVICPPSTYSQWVAVGQKLGIEVQPMSHAKFRMSGTLLSKTKPVIADEFHLFGGHAGKGWKKLDRLSRGLQAPLILASATPNYNDAERVYCIQHILDPESVKGGFLQFLYQNCITEQNPFSVTPDVLGFHKFAEAKDYLAALPGVFYLPDTVKYSIDDIPISEKIPPGMITFGYDDRRHKMIASIIEEKHQRAFYSLLDAAGELRDDVYFELTEILGRRKGSALIYANHSTIAEAIGKRLERYGVLHQVVTGKDLPAKKDSKLQAFKDGAFPVLVGTASLATGPDGLDKVCDTLVIVDDTEDDSLRRQLIGRILPRGKDTDASGKRIYRLVITWLPIHSAGGGSTTMSTVKRKGST